MTQPLLEVEPATELSLSSPGAVEPGFTSQLFAAAESNLRVLDIRMSEGGEAVRLIAGRADTAPEDGVSWADHLKNEDVRVERGQYVTVVARNVASVAQRVRAKVQVATVAGLTPGKAAAKPFKVAIANGPLPMTEPGPPVRFVLERGYAPYTLAFVCDNTPVPRSVRGAIVSAFDSAQAIRKPGAAPLPRSASAIEVVLPALLREKVGFSVRAMLPLQLHKDDRRLVAEAIEDALTGGGQAGKPAGQHESEPAPRQISKPTNPQEENVFMRNTILALEKRVADLEAAVKGQSDPSDSQLLPTAGSLATGGSS